MSELVDKIKNNPEKVIKELERQSAQLQFEIKSQNESIRKMEEDIKNNPEVNKDILTIIDQVKSAENIEELKTLEEKCNKMEEDILTEIENLVNNNSYLKNIVNNI